MPTLITDFVVPTSTAAFLNPDSTYPHHISSLNTDSDDEGQGTPSKNGMVVATFNTPPGKSNSRPASPNEENNETNNARRSLLSKSVHSQRHKDQLLEMSNNLDSLGWKKVIVDVREHMPFKIPNISNMVRKRSGYDAEFAVNNVSNGESQSLEKSSFSDILESRHVASTFSGPEDALHFPLGHNTMVAVEKHGLSKSIFKGGRPLMDGLAKEIVGEIFAWDDN